MGRPGAIVTRMNPHGWIFCGADSICYRVCRFSAKLHSQSSSAPRPVAGAGDPVATGLVESLARPGGYRAVERSCRGGRQASATSDPNALVRERPIEVDGKYILISLPLSGAKRTWIDRRS
jgi:hypothetical protein